MSTTGNEYERPGVNYPDREDAAGAADTPEQADPTRDGEITPPPAMGEPGPGSEPAEAWTEAGSQATPSTETDAPAQAQSQAPQGAAESEPSHEAVGIGVVDDGSDHHGQDHGRDTQTASEAQQTKGGLGPEQEQRLPAMAQNNASDIDKIAGIVAQTRQDIGTGSAEEIAHILKQRLEQSGVPLPDAEVEELVRQIRTGDAESPTQS